MRRGFGWRLREARKWERESESFNEFWRGTASALRTSLSKLDAMAQARGALSPEAAERPARRDETRELVVVALTHLRKELAEDVMAWAGTDHAKRAYLAQLSGVAAEALAALGDPDLSPGEAPSGSGLGGFRAGGEVEERGKESIVGETWFKARKTAIAEAREATPEDEEALIRRREGEALAVLGIDENGPVHPHYLVMRGGRGEEYPISREVFASTYEPVEE